MPRPAMFVEMVTAPRRPARAMMLASSASCFAFKTSHGIARAASAEPSSSDSRTVVVPTRTGLPVAMDARDFADDRGMLGLAGDEHEIRLVDAAARPMRRKDSRFESEERGKLRGRSFSRRGHAREPRVEPHEVLHRDRAEHAAFGAHRNSFLGLDRRLNAVGPSPVLGDPSRPLVDDFDPAVAHDIVPIAAEEHLGVQGDVDGAEQQVIRSDRRERRRGGHRRGRSQARS